MHRRAFMDAVYEYCDENATAIPENPVAEELADMHSKYQRAMDDLDICKSNYRSVCWRIGELEDENVGLRAELAEGEE